MLLSAYTSAGRASLEARPLLRPSWPLTWPGSSGSSAAVAPAAALEALASPDNACSCTIVFLKMNHCTHDIQALIHGCRELQCKESPGLQVLLFMRQSHTNCDDREDQILRSFVRFPWIF